MLQLLLESRVFATLVSRASCAQLWPSQGQYKHRPFLRTAQGQALAPDACSAHMTALARSRARAHDHTFAELSSPLCLDLDGRPLRAKVEGPGGLYSTATCWWVAARRHPSWYQWSVVVSGTSDRGELFFVLYNTGEKNAVSHHLPTTASGSCGAAWALWAY